MKPFERYVIRGLLAVAVPVAVYWSYTALVTQRVTHAMDAVQTTATQSMARVQEQQALRARQAEERAAAAEAEWSARAETPPGS